MAFPNIQRPAENLDERARTYYSHGPIIEKERFTSREYLQLENERLWSRTWNMVCRESEVRNVGDYYEFKLAGESILLIRETPDILRAVSNVCRHRGTFLKTGTGTTRELRCPFHGWTYAFDGRLTELTCEWDFPHVAKADLSLPSFQVDTWQGFVFVNLDRNAEPLRDFLEPIRESAETIQMEDFYRTFAIRIVVPCNWKLCQAAFMESYHVPWTHPQGAAFTTVEDNSCYSPVGRHAMFIHNAAEDGDTVNDPDPEASAGTDLDQLAVRRNGMRLMFPNWEFSHSMYARWLPNGDDPDSSIMETCFMAPVPETGERPLDEPFRQVDGADVQQLFEAWDQAPDLAVIANQDISNLRTIQQGMKSRFFPGVILSLYQESLIRHHLEIIDEYMRRP